MMINFPNEVLYPRPMQDRKKSSIEDEDTIETAVNWYKDCRIIVPFHWIDVKWMYDTLKNQSREKVYVVLSTRGRVMNMEFSENSLNLSYKERQPFQFRKDTDGS